MSTEKDPTLTMLINSIVKDVSELVSGYIETAKTEISHLLKNAARSIILLILGIALLGVGGMFALIASAHGLAATGVPLWISFLIIAGALIFVGILFSAVAVYKLKKIQPPLVAIESSQTRAQPVISIRN
jgi:TRAP-type C4-dicarboxylate transport system permease small subunit